MLEAFPFMKAFALILCAFIVTLAQQPREPWGAPAVSVSRAAGKWTVAGKKNTVTIDESNLGIRVQAGSTGWDLRPSAKQDLLLRSNGAEFFASPADARKKTFERYDTGFKSGIKIILQGWKNEV